MKTNNQTNEQPAGDRAELIHQLKDLANGNGILIYRDPLEIIGRAAAMLEADAQRHNACEYNGGTCTRRACVGQCQAAQLAQRPAMKPLTLLIGYVHRLEGHTVMPAGTEIIVNNDDRRFNPLKDIPVYTVEAAHYIK